MKSRLTKIVAAVIMTSVVCDGTASAVMLPNPGTIREQAAASSDIIDVRAAAQRVALTAALWSIAVARQSGRVVPPTAGVRPSLDLVVMPPFAAQQL
jgi:hypothetical protein